MRARSLKPGFFANPKLGKSDPINGWVYEGLWCMADPEGYLEDDEEKIHGEINRFRSEASTGQALGWLQANGFIARYVAEGKRCIFIIKFGEHQSPHFKEKPNKLPRYQAVDAGLSKAPDEPGTGTGLERGKPESSRSDSGLLTPHSLTADSPSIDSAKGGVAGDDHGKREGRYVFEPASVPNLNVEAYLLYMDYRKQRGFPRLLAISQREKWGELATRYDAATQLAMVKQTIANGWQGIFEIKRTNGAGVNGHRAHDDSHQSRTAPAALFDPDPPEEGASAPG